MRRYQLFSPVAWATAIVLFGATLANAQGADDSRVVTKVYRVFDLVSAMPHYPYQGLQLNGMSEGVGAPNVGGYGGGMGGGGMGGMGGGAMGGQGAGGMGGGFFQIEETLHQGGGFGGGGGGMPAGAFSSAPPQSANFQFTADDLIDAITSTVAPDTWDEVGGEGTLQFLGGMLIVSQTNAIHKQIFELLELIRSNSNGTTSVEIKAHWVTVKNSANIRYASDQADSRAVDRKWLNTAAAEAGAKGRIVCLDGQTVHLAAGNFRNAITGFTPVVGSNDRIESKTQLVRRPQSLTIPRGVLAQVASDASGGFANSRVGYQPESTSVNMGALLQVTPSLIPQSTRVIVDVRSIVTRSHPGGADTTEIANAGTIENLNLVAQQFMTTINMPVNQPIVVGGATLTPMSGDEGASEQLYLILEASPM